MKKHRGVFVNLIAANQNLLSDKDSPAIWHKLDRGNVKERKERLNDRGKWKFET